MSIDLDLPERAAASRARTHPSHGAAQLIVNLKEDETRLYDSLDPSAGATPRNDPLRDRTRDFR